MNTKQTVWKDIEGYEGHYQVSNRGEVRSKNRFVPLIAGGTRYLSGKMIKFKVNADEYRFVSLSVRGRSKTHYLHRLVAAAFIATADPCLEVNHINGRKSDNSVENLEWVTHAENMIHAYRTGLCGQTGRNHTEARQVIDNATGEIYGTIKEAASATNMGYSTLRNMLGGWNRNSSTLAYKDDEKGEA